MAATNEVFPLIPVRILNKFDVQERGSFFHRFGLRFA